MDNKDQMIEYMTEGCKEDSHSFLGLELEHFIVKKDTKEAVSFYGDFGIEYILKKISPYFEEEDISDGHVIGLNSRKISISLEPGAQFEISIRQQKKIEQIERIYQEFVQLLTPILEELGYEMVYIGYQPTTKVEDILILPKKRYYYMDLHFKISGTCGRNMMRGTAATQVSIDYKDEEEFVLKYRAGNLLGPIFAMITDNCPIFEGEPYQGNMLRQHIWENVDQERTGVISTLLDSQFGFKEYAAYIEQVPQIVHEDRHQVVIYTLETSAELFQNIQLSKLEIEQIFSMVFPDVRAKQYIEIRVADSMPFRYVLSYLALIKGLFTNTEDLNDLIQKLDCQHVEEIIQAKIELSQKSYDGIIYGVPVISILERMFEIAKNNLDKEEAHYLTPFKELVANRQILKEYANESDRNEENK